MDQNLLDKIETLDLYKKTFSDHIEGMKRLIKRSGDDPDFNDLIEQFEQCIQMVDKTKTALEKGEEGVYKYGAIFIQGVLWAYELFTVHELKKHKV